jgi:hypothetical protein
LVWGICTSGREVLPAEIAHDEPSEGLQRHLHVYNLCCDYSIFIHELDAVVRGALQGELSSSTASMTAAVAKRWASMSGSV